MEENRLPKSIVAAIVLAVLLLAHASIARSDERSREFALLVNGGGAKELNSSDFDERLSNVYRALVKRGVPKSRIAVLSGSGKTEDVRPNAFGASVSVDGKIHDYDRDGKTDVTGPARERSIEDILKEMGAQMKAGDRLTLVVTGPSKKEFLSGNTRVRLWGKDIDSKELGRLLARLPAGVETAVVTDVPFGGDFVKLTNERVCVFSAYDEKAVGYRNDDYLKSFAERLASPKSSVMGSHRHAAPSGPDSVTSFVTKYLSANSTPFLRKGSELCVDCVKKNALDAKDPPLSQGLAQESLKLSKDSSMEELIAVIQGKSSGYYSQELQARVAYFQAKSFKTRLQELEQDKRRVAESRSRAMRSPASSAAQAERQGSEIRAQIQDITKIEDELVVAHEQLMDELRFLASANPEALTEYSKRKGCAQHAF